MLPLISVLWGLLWRATLISPIVVTGLALLVVAFAAVPCSLVGACLLASDGSWWQAVALLAGGVTLCFPLRWACRWLLRGSAESLGGGYVL